MSDVTVFNLIEDVKYDLSQIDYRLEELSFRESEYRVVSVKVEDEISGEYMAHEVALDPDLENRLNMSEDAYLQLMLVAPFVKTRVSSYPEGERDDDGLARADLVVKHHLVQSLDNRFMEGVIEEVKLRWRDGRVVVSVQSCAICGDGTKDTFETSYAPTVEFYSAGVLDFIQSVIEGVKS